MTPCLAAALDYARSGFAVFPAPRGHKMSFKSARYNGGARWGATKDLDEIQRDWTRWPDANVCIACGAASSIFVVETDTVEGGHDADGAASLAELIEQFGFWPETRQAISPSGSRHYYFRTPSSGLIVRNSTGRLGPGIDVRGEGGMVVAPPSMKADGSVYRWLDDNAVIVNAPQWLESLVATIDLPHDHGDIEIVDAWLVAEAIKHVPVELNWWERNRIGMAIHAATNGSNEGLQIWSEWLQRSGKYNASATRQRWAAMARCPPSSIGFGSIAWRASQACRDWLDELDKRQIKERKNADLRELGNDHNKDGAATATITPDQLLGSRNRSRRSRN